MQFHIQLIDDPAAAAKRAEFRAAHWEYFDNHRDNFIARGATATDDLKQILSSVIYVEFESWDDVRAFVEAEPLNSNGVYQEVIIRRWRNGLKRGQRDFPRRDGQVYWYVRGYGKPGSHARREETVAAQQAYLAPYDETVIVARGPILDDDGKEWQGSANLICMPSRAELEAFLADWPYCQNGLYERVQIERYRFGGRPGQIV
ncbi:MAG: hypothetical protein HQ514_04180 [Rhodospirillales bacterium]|nr:hypothetical protein [Rhodospirillales bacterium]